MARRHYQFSSEDEVKSQRVKPKHHPPSKEKLREEARVSLGPRARCCLCGLSYHTSYMKFVYVKWREADWVCKDCNEEKSFPEAK